MLNSFNNILQFKGNVYPTDFLDILIIALLIYSLFVFLRNTRTYLVFFGIAITVGLYFAAKSLNLYVTLLTLRYFVGVAALIFVIIFQNEIRKYFEFLGLVGTRQIKVGPLAPRSPTTAEIIQACVKMAQTKTGALIIIQGKDDIDQFIDGGIDLDALISEELLLSIFDDHSEGHDGAVIIKNNRVSKFSAHLPLSTNFKEIGKHGTRHSAGLGLSEVSDSLAIIVSEEKGTISICKEGKMKSLQQFTDLEKELDKYIKSKFIPTPPANFISRSLKRDFILKVGALLTAFIVWFFAAYQTGIVHKSYSVPITLDKLPSDVVIESYTPKEVVINVSGRGNDTFTKLESDDLEVKIDVSELKNGANKQAINRKNISIPESLTLVSFEPTSILMAAKKYYMADIPIRAKTKGTVLKDVEIKSVVVNPESIKVWIPENTEAPKEIETEIIDISSQNESVIVPVKLIMPEEIRTLSQDTAINVALTIEKKQ